MVLYIETVIVANLIKIRLNYFHITIVTEFRAVKPFLFKISPKLFWPLQSYNFKCLKAPYCRNRIQM